MIKKNFTISIIREVRIDENRTPFTPRQVQTLIANFPNLNILVQPSKKRCFRDEDYSKAGAKIDEDISHSDIIFGVKEVEISKLIENKSYLFFSHTSKIRNNNNQDTQETVVEYKKELLREILKRNITLIDYENIRDNLGRRYIGFGRFAGIVGCYNTLNLHLKLQKKQMLPRAFEINNYEKIKKLISKQSFGKIKVLLTGRGRAARGSLEVLVHANIKQVSLKDYLNNKYEDAVFCNITTSEYVERKDGKDFSSQDFISNPHAYKSKIKQYLFNTDMLIASHYWDPQSPKLFSLSEINEFKNLKIIGDITCDINGSVPTTIKPTSIAKPYYSIDKNSFQEISLGDEGIAVMSVDNLPSELSCDSSEEFGNNILSEVLPYLINQDDGRIERATTASKGKFCLSFNYLENFIK